MSVLSVGFHREIYSPDTPQPQNSQMMAHSVLTDIKVTCACLASEGERVLVFSNDLRGFGTDFLEEYFLAVEEATGFDREHIMVNVTHNHSAPDVNFYGQKEAVTDWVRRICLPAVVRAALGAIADLSPVLRVTSGKSTVENANFVRRYFCEDGILRTNARKTDLPYAHETEADKEVRALRFYREGKKDVVFANFQVHAATALNVSKDQVCADFLHAFRETVEADKSLSVLYLQGGAGNLNYSSRIHPEACGADYDRAGRLIGEGVLRALAAEEERKISPIRVKRAYETGIVDHSRDHLAKKAAEIMKYCRENALDDKSAYPYYMEAGLHGRLDANIVIKKSKLEKTRQIPLSTLCFGDVGMTFAPFEMFDTNCRQIREASPFPFTLTMGYSNGSHHYLPSSFGFFNGGYETRQCNYVAGTGECVSLFLLRMLREEKEKL